MPFPADLASLFLEKAAALGLRAEDVEERFTLSRGHGGQNVNKRETAVQLRHVLTGMIVRCDHEREQHRNRLGAYELLILKLEEQARGKESLLQREKFKIRKQKARRTRRAKEKMLRKKHHRATIKEQRQEAWREAV